MDWNNIFIKLTAEADNGNIDAIDKLHSYYGNDSFLLHNFTQELLDIYNLGCLENKPYSLLQMATYNILQKSQENIEVGIDLLKKSMNAGCSQALCEYGMMIKNKLITTETDYEHYFNQAVAKNNSNAIIEFAYRHRDDKQKFIKYIKKAISLKNSSALHVLGEYYHDEQNYKLAIKYYKKGINDNNNDCLFNLAVMYRDGEGVKLNNDKAIELFIQSMNFGNRRAACALGSLYFSAGDILNGIKYSKIAVKKDDDPIACYNMGKIYIDNDKLKKAIIMFIKSAKNGNYNSQLMLCRIGIDENATDDDIDGFLKFRDMFKNFGAYDGI